MVLLGFIALGRYEVGHEYGVDGREKKEAKYELGMERERAGPPQV